MFFPNVTYVLYTFLKKGVEKCREKCRVGVEIA